MNFCQAIPNKQGFLENNDITIIEENKVITRERELAKTFNEHYINIVDKSSGIKPIKSFYGIKSFMNSVKSILENFESLSV